METQEDRGSISHWLEGLRAGDSIAAQELWDRYFTRLAGIARTRLKDLSGEVSGEDIALSAFKSVMIGVRENRFPNLVDRSGLWPLLITITARKFVTEQRRQLALKRTHARECRFEEVQDYIGVEPTPEFALEVADELERLVRALGDPTLSRIVEQKLGNFTNEEIADEMGCSVRTVIRKLKRIRQEWRESTGQLEGVREVD